MGVKSFERLPSFIRPYHYELHVDIDLEEFIFKGNVKIQINILGSSTNIIKLNASQLNVEKVELIICTEVEESLTPFIDYDIEKEQLILSFDKILLFDKAILFIKFSGKLNEHMQGFYKSQNVAKNGQISYAAVTQFESTYARYLFPCWDEPAFKAVFDLSILCDRNKITLSNMPIFSEKYREDGKKLVKFTSTPIMSTYLLAIVVGNFEFIEKHDIDQVLIRVYTPLGFKDQGLFALKAACRILPFFKRYFKIPYLLPKIDLIAISDFAYGAMENWGLVTYRQSALLIDSENSTKQRQQIVVGIIAHEFAHQWFGNLVTMEWWTHLWLNEGFASFMSDVCISELYPEYDIWTQFIEGRYRTALALDSLKNSHSVEVEVNDPAEINEIFDEISYNKGACILRMLHNYIGNDLFREGMHLYLKHHQYSNTTTDDLWNALENVCNKPIRSLMMTWTKQIGFPLIKILNIVQQDKICCLFIEQEQFCVDNKCERDKTLWMIPLKFTSENNSKIVIHEKILSQKNVTVKINNININEWIKINPGCYAFCHVEYPMSMLEKLLPALKTKSLSPVDRIGVVNDVFALLKLGRYNTGQFLGIISIMKNEDNYNVWNIIFSTINKLKNIICYTSQWEKFEIFVQELLMDILDKLGWEEKVNENQLDTQLRSAVLMTLISNSHAASILECKKRFDKYTLTGKTIPADIRSVIYRGFVRFTEQDNIFDEFIDRYIQETFQEEKMRLLIALTQSNNKIVLDKMLKFTMTDAIRLQDKTSVIANIAFNVNGRDLAWEFLKNNWSAISAMYESGQFLNTLIKYLIINYATNEKLDEIKNFFNDKDQSGIERTLKQSLEEIQLNIKWLDRDRENIENFFKQ